jgi:hypothetical protein
MPDQDLLAAGTQGGGQYRKRGMPAHRNAVVTVQTSRPLLVFFCLVGLLAGGVVAPLSGGAPDGQDRQVSASAPPAPGHTPIEAWPWWKDEAVVKELGLSPDKVRKMDGIYTRRLRNMKTFIDEYEAQRNLLDRLTRERTVDPETYQLQVSKFEMVRSKLSESRAVMLYQFYLELAPQQYQKFLEILDRRFRGRGGSQPR